MRAFRYMLCGVFLLLIAALVVLWIRSYGAADWYDHDELLVRPDLAEHFVAVRTHWQVRADHGRLAVAKEQRRGPSDAYAATLGLAWTDPTHNGYIIAKQTHGSHGAPDNDGILGSSTWEWSREPVGGGDYEGVVTRWAVPLWAIAAVMALPAVGGLLVRMRRRRAVRRLFGGFCAAKNPAPKWRGAVASNVKRASK